MDHYRIIDVKDCRTTEMYGHNEAWQFALTDIESKPSGEGWMTPPSPRFGADREVIGLRWKRPLSPIGQGEDTQPVQVTVRFA